MANLSGRWVLSDSLGRSLQASFRMLENGNFVGESDIGFESGVRHRIQGCLCGKSVSWTLVGETNSLIGSWNYGFMEHRIFYDECGRLKYEERLSCGKIVAGHVQMNDFDRNIFFIKVRNETNELRGELRLRLLDGDHLCLRFRPPGGTWQKELLAKRFWKGYTHSMVFSGTLSESGHLIENGCVAYQACGFEVSSFVACRAGHEASALSASLPDLYLPSGRALQCRASADDGVLTLRILLADELQVSLDQVTLLDGSSEVLDSCQLGELATRSLQVVIKPDRESYMRASVREALAGLTCDMVPGALAALRALEVLGSDDLHHVATGLLDFACQDGVDLRALTLLLKKLTPSCPIFHCPLGKSLTLMRKVLEVCQASYEKKLHPRLQLVRFSGALFAEGLFGLKVATCALEDIVEPAESATDLEAFHCACEFLLASHYRLLQTDAGVKALAEFQVRLGAIWSSPRASPIQGSPELQHKYEEIMRL